MKLDFNHAMIYAADVERAKQFYAGVLGFRVLEEELPFYVRLQSPGSKTTLALHKAEPGAAGLRLYFETAKLDELCAGLAKKGVKIDKPPADMPWGWRHAYLRDPDGHEISLYRAGAKRLRQAPKRKASQKAGR